MLPPCVSTRKKRRMASPDKPLFRTSIESAPEAPAESSKPAQPKFLGELSQVLHARASTPDDAAALVPKPASRLSSSSSKEGSHSSSTSGKSKVKRTVIKVGAGGKIRTSAHAAELVAEQEESLRVEASMSLDRSRDKSIDKTSEIANWSRNVGSILPTDLGLRRSESLQSSSSRLTRHGNSSESREGTPVSLASLSSLSSRDSLPARPQNPTPRTASPHRDHFDLSTSLPPRPSAPALSDSSFSTSAPKRPSNPTPTHAHTIRASESPAPTKTKLSKSASDAEPAKPKQPLTSSIDRPIKRFPARKAVPAPVPAKPARSLPQPVAAAPKVKALARKRQSSDPPRPQTFPARVRNGPPVLTPAKKTSKLAPKTRLPVPAPTAPTAPDSTEPSAKRAKVTPVEPEEPAGSTTPPHVVEALATPRRHSVTVRRTPRGTTPRRTPAPISDWPELGLNKEQTAFTFEHRLRQAAEESPAVDPPSISYPSYPSYPAQSARRESYATDTDSDDDEMEIEEEEEEGADLLNPMEEFDIIRPHGQELSAVLEVTEGEVSALSQRSAFTPLGRPPQAVVPPMHESEDEDEYDEEPTPKAIVIDEPATKPTAELEVEPEAEPEQDADTSASSGSSGDSSLRRLGEGVLGFLAGLVSTPAPAAPAATAPAPVMAPTVPAAVQGANKQAKPVRVIKNKPVRAKGKENASVKPRTRPESKPQPVKTGETKNKDMPRYALATAAVRAHGQEKQPTEKRKRDAGSPQRNVRRKVPAASALSTRPLRSLPRAPLGSAPKETASASSRPIKSMPSTRSSGAAARSTGASRSVSATSAASSSSSTSRGPRTGSTVTAFTAAALARLPKPGETKAKSSPVKIRDLERARDLAVRKAVFERFHPDADVSLSNMSFGSTAPTQPTPAPLGESSSSNTGTTSRPMPPTLNGKAKNLTVPMSGKTPGKASKMRAASRAKFDAKVARKAALKAKEDEERERIRRQVEEEMDRERRRATVIRARPLPEMYRGRK